MSDTQLNQAEQQAMWWQARLSSDLLSEHDFQEFESWLAECPNNVAAWQTVNDFWTSLNSVKLDNVIREQQEIPLKTDKIEPCKTSHPYLKAGLALAASFLLMLTLDARQIGYYLADYRCATGQQQQIVLSDGSTVELNTASAFSIDFSDHQRLINLHQGEAFFKVAADSQRPFVVKTEAGQVQALGTAFDVKQLDDKVSVTVFEHAVKITTATGQVKEHLAESEQMSFNRDSLNAVSHVNLTRAGAWHQQRMIFQNKALAEVVEELERYRPGRIIVINDSIKNLPITGVFGTADTNIALETIGQSLPVNVTKITDQLVLLSAK